ncbi:MAG: WavE lipopolysaccharide synthesis family protein [Pseudomonadota bacterium]
MKTTDITLVFQGVFKPYVTRDFEAFERNIRFTRKVLPGAKVILSTWEGTEVPASLAVDAVVMSPDPGALAPLKLDDDKANNVNRQLLSTRAGMDAVTTPYAAKIRTDCHLQHAGFIDFYSAQRLLDGGRERLLACSFFTPDPTMFERLPYHVSDWFHFGPTGMLRDYWSAQQMLPQDARYYESQTHAPDSTFFEKKFRSRFAVEQHICMQFAQGLGYTCPRYLNDVSEPVLRDYLRFLGREIMLLDPWQIGVMFNKYAWVGNSHFQQMNNLMHLDWLALANPALDGCREAGHLRALIRQRARKKNSGRLAFQYSRILHALLFDASRNGHPVRRIAARLARRL